MTKSRLKHPAKNTLKQKIAKLSAIVFLHSGSKNLSDFAEVGKKNRISTIIIKWHWFPSIILHPGWSDGLLRPPSRKAARSSISSSGCQARISSSMRGVVVVEFPEPPMDLKVGKGLRQLFTSRTFYSVSQGGNSCVDIRLPKEMKGLLQKKNYKILVLLCTLRYPEITNVYRPSTGDSQIKVHNVSTFYPELEH